MSKKEVKKDAAKLLSEFLQENNIIVDIQIQKKRSADTGAWYDVPLLVADYRKQKQV